MPDIRRPVTRHQCGWNGTVGQCEQIAPSYMPKRVPSGDVMPAPECPKCGPSRTLREARHEPDINGKTVFHRLSHDVRRPPCSASVPKFIALAVDRWNYSVHAS